MSNEMGCLKVGEIGDGGWLHTGQRKVPEPGEYWDNGKGQVWTNNPGVGRAGSVGARQIVRRAHDPISYDEAALGSFSPEKEPEQPTRVVREGYYFEV